MIDRLDPDKMRYEAQEHDTPADRVLGMNEVMKKDPLLCLLLPSYRTLHHLVMYHDDLFQTRGKDTFSEHAARVVANIKTSLLQECTHPTRAPSWIDQAQLCGFGQGSRFGHILLSLH